MTFWPEPRRFSAHRPWWGLWTCTIIAYDAAKDKVALSDGWGYTKSFPIAGVWINPHTRFGGRARISAILLGVGAAAGAVIDSVITVLLLQ